MNLIKCEKLEKSMAELQFSIDAEAFKKAVADVFKKEGKKYPVQGFRKGKAPKAMIEKMYGKDLFQYDAINDLFPENYEAAVKEAGIEVVGRPDPEVVSMSEDEGATLKVKVAVKPEVELGEYTGLTVNKDVKTVDEADVDAEIKRMQDRNGRLLTREGAAENGDTVDIDFEGFVDGVAFEGGKAEHYSLVLGSGSFIPGFEDQLVGLSKGDSTDVEVTFPEDYFVKDLAGKEAIFKVNIQDVKRKELPELNDEYVASKTDFKTVEELRANYKERMQKAAEANTKAEYEHELIDLAVANAKFSVPEIMIEDKISQMVEEMKMSLESRKMSLDMYMQYTGLDMAKIRENQRPVAEENVKTDLVLDAIAKAEDIQVDMADVDAEIAAISAQHGASPEEVKKIIKGNGTMGLLLANILRRKAAHVVIDSAK